MVTKEINSPRRVLIGTPSYDGKLDAWYCNSLVDTIKLSAEYNIHIDAVYLSYDALVQRARNSLFEIAIEGKYDDLIFIDADVHWDPNWIFKLLSYAEPIVGGALIKKSDIEGYTIKLLDATLKWNVEKTLIEVDGVGTGFVKISKFAIEKLWEMSEKYSDTSGDNHRMVFDIEIKDGNLVSEDFVMCNKWKSLGYKIWVDPTMSLTHVGNKIYTGHFTAFLEKNGFK